MLKKLFTVAIAVLLGFGLYAQNSLATKNDTIWGANGAMTIIRGQATAGYPEFLSADARFMAGVYGGAMGYAYDFEKDTCLLFMESTLSGYVSENHYVGQDDPGDTYANSYVYYNGEKIPLEKTFPSDKVWGEVFVQTVQSNCDKIVTMVYELSPTAQTEIHYNRAAIHDGKTGKLLCTLPWYWEEPLVDEDKKGYGSRGDCISADGTVVGGHSTNPDAKSNWTLTFWDISDLNNIKTFGLEGRTFDFGSFYGASSDGSLLAGGSETKGYGIIVHYNKAAASYTVDTIGPLPSWDNLTFTAIADNGMAIGYCGMLLDPGTREPIVYTPRTGVVKMTDYLYEYYDIDVRKGYDFYTPYQISRDGKRIIGFNFESPTIPYSHELSETRIIPRARKISARAFRGEEKAVITWQEPLTSEHILTGYNIYLDNDVNPLNTTVLPVSQTTYTDNTVKAGRHTYYIEAVYSDGVSPKQASNQIQVVPAGVAFPVQAVNHRVDYNRFANIYWGLPSSEVVALAKNNIIKANVERKGQLEYIVENMQTPNAEVTTAEPVKKPQAKSYISTTLDYIANVDMLTYAGSAAIKIGEYYYTTTRTGGGIKVIDRFNDVVKTIQPDNLGIVVSMVYLEDLNQLYCGTSKGLINVLDMATEKVVKQFEIRADHLSYIPDMKDGQPGLVAGGPHSCNTYLWNEAKKDYVLDEENILDFGPLYAMGSTYYKGRLYVGSASGPYYNEVYVYDFATRKQIGEPIQLLEDPAMYDLMTMNGNSYILADMSMICQPGSLSVCELEDGTTALGIVFKCAYMTARFMMLELESAETVAGYDLFRSANGGEYQQVNPTDKPLKTRRYSETIDKAGKYTYYVVVKSENDKPDSDMSPVDTVTIVDQGSCPEPDFSIKESNRWPYLEWMPGECDLSLVGFDLYRDGQHIERLWLNDLRLDYIDEAVTELGTYNYRIETLYAEGCMAAAEKSVTLTGDGAAKGPFGVAYTSKLNGDKTTYNVTATWETPLFEEPLSIGYCNGLQGEPIGFDNFYQCIGLIGWSGKDLDPYRDLYLVGMEYMLGATPEVYEALVYIDDEQVYRQAIKQITAREWRTVMFNKSFPMDQKEEIAVGFNTRYTDNSGVLGVDPTITKDGKSNIISLDGGAQWSTLQTGGVTGSWLIKALVVRKRDLEAAMNADGSIDHSKLAGSIMRMSMDGKAPLTLVGFNVYRTKADVEGSEVKLNDALLTSFELTDINVPGGEYDYEVAAVYSDGSTVRSSVYVNLKVFDPDANEDMNRLLNLNVYPNPASEWINVEGEYETLQIFDFAGHLLRTQPAATQIKLGDLTPGTYFLHFTGADARKAVYKIVVR